MEKIVSKSLSLFICLASVAWVDGIGPLSMVDAQNVDRSSTSCRCRMQMQMVQYRYRYGIQIVQIVKLELIIVSSIYESDPES